MYPRGQNVSRLARGWCALLALAGLVASTPAAAATPEGSGETAIRVLTNARDVKHLTAEQAKRALPVRLRGVVIYYNQHNFNDLLVHDETGGIYISDTKAGRFQLQFGDLVEVEGVSGAGDYAPVVRVTNLRVVGTGPAPVPREIAYQSLALGGEDAEWVQLRGIIRSTRVVGPAGAAALQVDLMTSGGRLTARVPIFDPARLDRLVDAEVVVTGACTPVFNRRRQLLDVRLSVPTDRQIEIVAPAPADPFAGEPRAINRLQQYEPGSTFGHRVKVRGTVTLRQPGQALFIRDQTQGLWLRTRQSDPVALGDEIEALGFLARGGYSPVLEDASYRVAGRHGPIAPLDLGIEQVREGNADCDLIRLEGELLDWIPNPAEHVLLVRAKDVVFGAHLPTAGTAVAPLPLHSRVRLTGVCIVQMDSPRGPHAFRLLLRSADDVVVLQTPSWWTPGRLAWALGLISLVALVGGVWVVSLRRRVAEQTRVISAKIRDEAILQERHRMAREIHDTLVQSFAAISLQLEAVRDKLTPVGSGAVSRHLEIAHRLARESLADARRSIWALHSATGSGANLAAALTASLKSITDGTGIANSVAIAGDMPRLPTDVENHLLYIAREACLNAAKHAAPNSIRLELRREGEALHVAVQDDGCGYAREAHGSAAPRGFGLISMEERAQQIRADFRIASGHGQGTRVEVTVPLNGG